MNVRRDISISLVSCLHVMSFLLMGVLITCCASRYKPPTAYAIASWYGVEFHGKPTSSGEIFNMYGYTCAHKEYPFGTKLKITNTINDKSVNCIVNDRGPFVPGREVDLSYAAAKDIDLLETGTATVRIDNVGRDTSYVREVQYLSNDGPFTIQVGSYKDASNASRMKTGLEMKYSKVYIASVEIKGEKHYRVRIGKYDSKSEVKKLGTSLASEGYTVLITHYEENI